MKKSVRVLSTSINFIAAALILTACTSHSSSPNNSTAVTTSINEYAATARADRIVLMPGEHASTEMRLAYRSTIDTDFTQVELAKATASPGIGNAQVVQGNYKRIDTENGPAHYHRVEFSSLTPNTTYAYRIKTQSGMGEWFQFTTPSDDFTPFNAIYFGDIQNSIRDIAARTMRAAFKASENAQTIISAGDLVASREEVTHDTEWGQWWSAGSFVFAETPQIVAAGNHEYVDAPTAQNEDHVELIPHWDALFNVPENGAEVAKKTSYHTQFNGVDFYVLDGTAALKLGEINSQGKWLDEQLTKASGQWQVVVMHQPIYTCARPTDTEELKAAWAPIFEKHKVALVLQGHDHCYSRHQAQPQGSVYYVTVVGSKMYGLNDRVENYAQYGEDTQLFQLVHFDKNTIEVKTYTAIGELYDHVSIKKSPQGVTLIEHDKAEPRRCSGKQGPDGLACNSRAK